MLFRSDSSKTATAYFVKKTINISAIFEGWKDNGDETYTAYFGYENKSTIDRGNGPEPYVVNEPVGANNKLTPSTNDNLLPTTFGFPNVVSGRPGRTSFYPGPGFAFVVENWDGSNIVWSLFGRTATASLNPALEKKDTYTLTTSVRDNIGGEVSAYPEKDRFEEGEAVGVYAYPDHLYVLDYWVINGVITAATNPLDFEMYENKVIEAVFEPALTITKVVDKAEARNGDTLKYTISVANNYPADNGDVGVYNGWTSLYDIEVLDEMLWPDAPKHIDWLDAGQSITYTGSEDGCWYVVPQGATPRTLTNTATARVPLMTPQFGEYEGPEHFEVSALASVTIVSPPSPPPYDPPADPVIYVVEATAEAGGSATGGGKFLPGLYANLTATPGEGYTFSHWSEGEEVISTEADLTFMVLKSRTLTANFSAVVEPPAPPIEPPIPPVDPPVPPVVEPPLVIIIDEPLPEAPAVLPQTGEVSAMAFYGLGTALAVLGAGLKKRK